MPSVNPFNPADPRFPEDNGAPKHIWLRFYYANLWDEKHSRQVNIEPPRGLYYGDEPQPEPLVRKLPFAF
jgi:hypothetical protein